MLQVVQVNNTALASFSNSSMIIMQQGRNYNQSAPNNGMNGSSISSNTPLQRQEHSCPLPHFGATTPSAVNPWNLSPQATNFQYPNSSSLHVATSPVAPTNFPAVVTMVDSGKRHRDDNDNDNETMNSASRRVSSAAATSSPPLPPQAYHDTGDRYTANTVNTTAGRTMSVPKRTRSNVYIPPRQVPRTFTSQVGSLAYYPNNNNPQDQHIPHHVGLRRQLSSSKIEGFLSSHDTLGDNAMEVSEPTETTSSAQSRPRSMSF
jgi:hypothetical protein